MIKSIFKQSYNNFSPGGTAMPSNRAKKTSSSPFVWPKTVLKMTWMWGNYHPAAIAPPGAWLFVATLLVVMGPIEYNMMNTFSVPSVIEAGMYTLMSAIATVKVFVVARSTKSIVKMEDFLKSDIAQLETAVKKEASRVTRDSRDASARFCRLYFIAQAQLVIVTASKILFNVALPREERQLPFIVPDLILRNDALFWSYTVCLLLVQYFFILGVGAFDTLYVCVCSQLEGKIYILGHMFTRISAVRQEEMETIHTITGKLERQPALWDSPDTARAVRSYNMASELERCVLYHQKLIEFRDQIEGIFTKTAFYSLMYFVLALGAPALRIMYDKNIGVADALFNVIMAFTVLLQLTLLCWFGDKVAKSSEHVRDAAFFAYREGMSFRTRSALLMIILRTQKPMFITADNFADLTVNLLMSVMRRSNSLYSAAFNLR